MPKIIPAANDIYTISRLNREVRTVLEDVFPSIWVQGEISNLAKPASGHIYFSLKDDSAQVRCAMFKNRQSGLRFTPENGMQVLARANISLYEGRGEFQLIIESLEPAGEGALQLAFEQLKQKLDKEGLFAQDHKKELPSFPETIGIITSSTGAALRDILSVLSRRYPMAQIIIYPVPVQGEGAGIKISEMIKVADQRSECDVLILSRGGGSIEDLWAFNEEIVARAIFSCQIPIVSGVGHEIDFTISDFVSDQRAPTPSAAAEMVSPDSDKILAQIIRYHEQLMRSQQQLLGHYQNLLEHLFKRLPHPQTQLQQYNQRIDEFTMRISHILEKQISRQKLSLTSLSGKISKLNPVEKIKYQLNELESINHQLYQTISHIFKQKSQEILSLEKVLNTVSPLATLDRGYAIVTEAKTKSIVGDVKKLKTGDKLNIKLSKANINSTIDDINEE